MDELAKIERQARRPAATRTGVRVAAAARLHFGLLEVVAPFGGCGVMIDGPLTVVEVRPATRFDPGRVHTGRIEAIARRWADRLARGRLPAVRVDVIQAPPPHTGLGSGTPISLAVAEAISLVETFGGETPFDAVDATFVRRELIELADRGHRSAVGSHGYFQGGMIVEGIDHDPSDRLNSVAMRLELPTGWRVVVWLPEDGSGETATVSGDDERRRFDELPRPSPAHRQSLRRCLTDELIPAAMSGDFVAFGDAVSRYNHRSGELFAAVQGGAYHGPLVTAAIESLVRQGVVGVGQSSWGPGIFAWCQSASDAESIAAIALAGYRPGLIAAVQSKPRSLELLGTS